MHLYIDNHKLFLVKLSTYLFHHDVLFYEGLNSVWIQTFRSQIPALLLNLPKYLSLVRKMDTKVLGLNH